MKKIYKLTDIQIKLIVDTKKYILEYCDKNNFDIVVNYILNINCIEFINDNDDIIIFIINYKNYKYVYTIKLINNKVIFQIKLKNSKEYTTEFNNKTEFNTLIEYMLNDNN